MNWSGHNFEVLLSSCFLRRPQKMTKSSPLIRHYVVSVKSMVNISSIFVGFLENMKFDAVHPVTVLDPIWVSRNLTSSDEFFVAF